MTAFSNTSLSSDDDGSMDDVSDVIAGISRTCVASDGVLLLLLVDLSSFDVGGEPADVAITSPVIAAATAQRSFISGCGESAWEPPVKVSYILASNTYKQLRTVADCHIIRL